MSVSPRRFAEFLYVSQFLRCSQLNDRPLLSAWLPYTSLSGLTGTTPLCSSLFLGLVDHQAPGLSPLGTVRACNAHDTRDEITSFGKTCNLSVIIPASTIYLPSNRVRGWGRILNSGEVNAYSLIASPFCQATEGIGLLTTTSALPS